MTDGKILLELRSLLTNLNVNPNMVENICVHICKGYMRHQTNTVKPSTKASR
jgi:hypothetical protein